jgi:hypothetical protein
VKIIQEITLKKGFVYTRTRSWFRHYVTKRKVAGSTPYKVAGFFNWPNPSAHNMSLRSTQPLTEMSTRKFPGVKGDRLGPKADNPTAICEPVVQKMWKPRCLTTLWVSMTSHRDSFTLCLKRLLRHRVQLSRRFSFVIACSSLECRLPLLSCFRNDGKPVLEGLW